MRRTILLAFVAALALAIGLSSVAAAGQDGAAVSAKKGKNKGKRCKSKGKGKAKGKNKSKAHRSATASKKKGKKRGCKGRGKGGSLLAPGTYEGQDGIGLKVTAGGKMATLTYTSTPGSRVRTCIPVALELPEEPATSTATSFRAGGKPNSVFGGSGEITWTIEVTSGLRYTVRLDSSFAFPEQLPCNEPGAVFRGMLKKTG